MPRIVTALLLATLAAPACADAIYKYVDADGHVTFTNVPRAGAKLIMQSPGSGSSPANPRKKTSISQPQADSGGIPSIDSGTQKQRDQGRRRILETELANEHKALLIARGSLLEAQQKAGSKPEQLQRLRDEITDRERNISALKRELGS
ncbi:DUF4124 domain-containing protein [Vogesella amnigena]|uniref:DUF4124 domain-containing protein n=1 Tax=Vogesella amnigena TaxID=1507449 RepID=A0ABV7TVQ4_9NEIS